MGFRPPLDLSGFIKDYQPFLGGQSLAGVHYVSTDKPEADINDFEPIPDVLKHQQNPVGDEPWKVGNGPPAASTCREMVSARSRFSWDVNGYYRLLGIPWPYVHATKGMLSKAYIAVDGQSSHRKTYYLKQLLNPVVRAEYDAMPLGKGPYLEDIYVQDMLKAKAAAEAGRRTAAGVFTEAKAVMDEWGYKLVLDEDLDTKSNGVKDDAAPKAVDPFSPIEWTFSYWLWRSNSIDTDRLAAWQALLVSALSEAGARLHVAIGYLGRQPHPFVIGKAQGHWIVYFNDRNTPGQETASKAASALLRDIENDSKTLNPI